MQVPIEVPHLLNVGFDILGEVGPWLRERSLSGRRVMLVVGNTTGKRFGQRVYESIQSAIGASPILVPILDARLSTAFRLYEHILGVGPDTVLALGGGRTLDVAKYAASLARVPFISIPTALSHDGIASPVAVLADYSGKGRSLGCAVPAGVFVDLTLCLESPKQLVLAGIGDVISNYTAIFDWRLSHERRKEPMHDLSILLAETATRLLLHSKVDDPLSPELLGDLAQALVLNGVSMSLCGSSRPCSGSEHLFSHALDAKDGPTSLHGLQVAVGTVLCAHLQGRDWLGVLRKLRALGVPATPQEIGLSAEQARQALLDGPETRRGRYSILDDASPAALERALSDVMSYPSR